MTHREMVHIKYGNIERNKYLSVTTEYLTLLYEDSQNTGKKQIDLWWAVSRNFEIWLSLQQDTISLTDLTKSNSTQAISIFKMKICII